MKTRRAFSLVEMMVAMTVLALVLILMVGIVGQIGGISQTSSRQIAARQNVRAIFGLIRQDLAAAVMPLDSASQTSFQFVVNPAGLPEQCANPDALFLHSRVATESSEGNLASIGYFVRWENDKPSLYRFQANASDRENFLLYQDPLNWIPFAKLEQIAMPVSEGIGGFFVDCFKRNSGGELESVNDYDSRTAGALPDLVTISILSIHSDSRVVPLQEELLPLYEKAEDARRLFELLPERLRRDVRVHETSYSPGSL